MYITLITNVSYNICYCKHVVKIIYSLTRTKIINLLINPSVSIALTLTNFNNVEGTLKQRCYNVVTRLYNVILTLSQRRAPTLYQFCATFKIWRQFLVHFQRLIKCWSEVLAGAFKVAVTRFWKVVK